MGYFENMGVGQRRDLGSFIFTGDLIKTFASQFDPQPFHLDEDEGRKSLFGGLAASGWHVVSVWMKLMVADSQREAAEAATRGGEESPGLLGASGCQGALQRTRSQGQKRRPAACHRAWS